jgi:hypothetical protein
MCCSLPQQERLGATGHMTCEPEDPVAVFSEAARSSAYRSCPFLSGLAVQGGFQAYRSETVVELSSWSAGSGLLSRLWEPAFRHRSDVPQRAESNHPSDPCTWAWRNQELLVV